MSSMSVLSIWVPEFSWSLIDSKREELAKKKYRKYTYSFEAITQSSLSVFSEKPLGLTPIIQARASDDALGLNQSLA